MTDWSPRVLLNVAYAYLVEQCDAADRAAEPVFLAAGVKGSEVADMARRRALEDWLSAPTAQQAEADSALIRYLGVA